MSATGEDGYPCEGAEYGVCGGVPHTRDCPSFRWVDQSSPRDAESTSAALARVTAERDKALGAFNLAEELRLKATAERDYALNLAEALRRTIAELADERAAAQLERDHARSERDALKALYADAVKRLNTQP